MAEESPFIEKEEPEESAEAEAKVDVDALMKTLEKFDVQSPEKLQGKLQNARDYADVRSERDRFANEIAQLRAEVMNVKQPQPKNYDEYQEGQPIDIENLVSGAVSKALQEEKRAQFEYQKRMNDTWMKITGHKRYHLVKDEFESALKDPATVMKLTSGQIDAFEFYTDLVMDKMAGVARQSVEAFKQMRGTSGVKPPHVESGANVPQFDKEKQTAKQKKTDELLEKSRKSKKGLSESEIDDFFDANFSML